LPLQEGVQHRVIETGELQNESFLNNPPDRCFFCKQDLFLRMRRSLNKNAFRLFSMEAMQMI